MNSKKPGELDETLTELNALKKKATDIIKDLKPFTKEAFEKKFTDKQSGQSLSFHFQEAMDGLARSQVKTHLTYKNALASLLKFFKRDPLLLEITPKSLDKYELWMLEEGKVRKKKKKVIGTAGNSVTTVALYMRVLRTIFLKAMSADAEAYPFGDGKYEIPAHADRDARLSVDQMVSLLKYEADSDATEKARDMFMFTYFCFGCNAADLCLLKYNNIHGNEIKFFRKKTQRKTKKKQQPKQIIVPITSEMRGIMKRWGNKDKSPGNYIFPELNDTKDALQERAAIDLFIHRCNDGLARIAKETGILKLTLSYARRTAANTQRDAGIPYHVIQQNMGHAKFSTTEKYLGVAKTEDVRAASQALVIPFNKIA